MASARSDRPPPGVALSPSAARLVVRAAWNEQQEALGKDRKRPRRLGPDAAVTKEMRAWLKPFLEAPRKELGIQGELAPEPDD